MGTPWGPKYIPYTYMDPLGLPQTLDVIGMAELDDQLGEGDQLLAWSSNPPAVLRRLGFKGLGVRVCRAFRIQGFRVCRVRGFRVQVTHLGPRVEGCYSVRVCGPKV